MLLPANVTSLIGTFPDCVAAYEGDPTSTFWGPALYFHVKTIDRLNEVGLSSVLANPDDEYYGWLYATLAAWYRTAATPNPLADFYAFRDSITGNAGAISGLAGYGDIRVLPPADVPAVAGAISEFAATMTVGSTATWIVVNSKALHHLLPCLVPPIDRKYTLNLVFGSGDVWPDQVKQFAVVYQQFCSIAAARATEIQGVLDLPVSNPWHTSSSKVIDNAIMGWTPTAAAS